MSYSIDDNLYKVNINFEDSELLLTLKITRVDAKDVFAVEFTRKGGDYWEYLSLAETLQKKVEFGLGYREVDPDEEVAQEQSNLEEDNQ